MRPSRSQASSPSTLLARALEPWAGGLWVFFCLVSLVVGVVWAFGLGDAHPASLVSNRELLRVLQWLLHYLDLLWITLAAANAYFCLVTREGLATARRWSLTVIVSVVTLAWLSTSVTVLAWLSERTGFPFKPIQYAAPLGMRFGPVPIGLPLFWFAVLVGAREGLLRYFPRWSHFQVALGAGLIGVLTDLSVEPLAAKLRGFWFWRSGVPASPPLYDVPGYSCFIWGALLGLLAFSLRDVNVVAATRPRSWKPAAILAIFHLVFLAAHLGRWVRG